MVDKCQFSEAFENLEAVITGSTLARKRQSSSRHGLENVQKKGWKLMETSRFGNSKRKNQGSDANNSG
jgi:hypothetical protein